MPFRNIYDGNCDYKMSKIAVIITIMESKGLVWTQLHDVFVNKIASDSELILGMKKYALGEDLVHYQQAS